MQWHKKFNVRIVSFFLADSILKPHKGFVGPLDPDAGPCRQKADLKEKIYRLCQCEDLVFNL